MGRGEKGKLGFLLGSYSCPRWAITITEHAGSGEHQELGDKHICSELGVGWGIEWNNNGSRTEKTCQIQLLIIIIWVTTGREAEL